MVIMMVMEQPAKIVRIPVATTKRDGIRAAITFLKDRAGETHSDGDRRTAVMYREVAEEISAALL